MKTRKLRPHVAYLLKAADYHQPLLAVLQRLSATATDLDSSIDGVTDQFDRQRRKLQREIAVANRIITALKGGRS
jgi:hypothetical protein